MKKAKTMVSVIASMAIAAAMAVSVSAENEPAKAVVAVEKFTIGGGFVLEPTVIELEEGDSAAAVFEKALGAENLNGGDGAGTYIASIKTSSEGELLPEITAALPEGTEVTAPADSQWLASFDYYSMSGWMFLINGESSMVGAADYTVNDGDVLQLCFSVIGYGSDIGLDTSSMADWGGMAPLYNVEDRTECYSAAFTNSDIDWSSVANVYATAEDCEAIINSAADVEEADDEVEEDTTDNETAEADEEIADTTDEAAENTSLDNSADKTDNPSTGVADVTAVALVSLGALAIAVSAKKRS
ncbi:MAG: DUF4430 domain-containing protein [Ruminiclostridium sp.]